MSSSVRGLQLVDLNALPAIDDAYLIISEPDSASQRSFYGRDLRFSEMTQDNLLQVAEQLANQAVKKLLLLSPTPAWQQMSRFQHGLMNAAESRLASLPFESLVILRPVAQSKSSTGSLLQKFAGFYLDLQMMMLPRSIPVLTSEQLGRLAVIAMADAKAGVSVLQAEQIARMRG